MQEYEDIIKAEELVLELLEDEDEPLYQELKALANSPENESSKARKDRSKKDIEETHNIEVNESFMDLFLSNDERAIGTPKHPKSTLEDFNVGHWDLYPYASNSNAEKRVKFLFKNTDDKPIYARNACKDVQKNAYVAIDFGTKSTVVGIWQNGEKRLLKLGSDIQTNPKDYENPTILEFCNIENFLNAYLNKEHRPYTSCADLNIAHTAHDNFITSMKYSASENPNEFYRFFSKLKQWAGSNQSISIMDNKNHESEERYEIKSIFDEDSYINPIELYAYYIGRFINQMNTGVYINYLLSYPVKYEKKNREKILESFEKGLKKSLPHGVLDKHQLSVEFVATEPAAYAISALDKYGFYSEKYVQEKTFYGVFDFGGGTTDFDFGVWLGSEKRGKEFKLVHFAQGGNEKLGGENLLELLAYNIFIAHIDVMQQNNICICMPNFDVKTPGGLENSILRNAPTMQSRKNLAMIVDALRPLVEEHFNLDNIEKLKQGQDIGLDPTSFSPSLTTNEGKVMPISLERIDFNKCYKTLQKRIHQGVMGFFEAFRKASDYMQGLDELHIFLGGNASKSPIVMKEFSDIIKEKKEKSKGKLDFKLYPALGTKEAISVQKKLGVYEHEGHFTRVVTCKSGVAFGLLECRKSSKIEIISEIKEDDEAGFKFYIGTDRMKKFSKIIDKGVFESKYIDFLDYMSDNNIDIYYTSDDFGASNQLAIKDERVKNITYTAQDFEEDYQVKIKIINANSIVVGIFDSSDKLVEESEVLELN
ncbi:hypothetical protein [Helicobacter cetorum]|uniref:hypothetical protein n=1 Tax=Helicobacter cetorum TaxID=138563 RepID=UPI000CF13CB3|nr:hypothetical protein [Helicobacter cetorum]